jgi:hypothetical protein
MEAFFYRGGLESLHQRKRDGLVKNLTIRPVALVDGSWVERTLEFSGISYILRFIRLIETLPNIQNIYFAKGEYALLRGLIHAPWATHSRRRSITISADDNSTGNMHFLWRPSRVSPLKPADFGDKFSVSITRFVAPFHDIKDVEHLLTKMISVTHIAFPLRWPRVEGSNMLVGPYSLPDDVYTDALLALPTRLKSVILILGAKRRDSPTERICTDGSDRCGLLTAAF